MIRVTFPIRTSKFCCAILSRLCLQLHSIRSTRRRSCASAAPWAGTSSAGSGPSLPAPKPSTADAASTRRWSAERFRTGPHRTARRQPTPALPLCCPLVEGTASYFLPTSMDPEDTGATGSDRTGSDRTAALLCSQRKAHCHQREPRTGYSPGNPLPELGRCGFIVETVKNGSDPF